MIDLELPRQPARHSRRDAQEWLDDLADLVDELQGVDWTKASVESWSGWVIDLPLIRACFGAMRMRLLAASADTPIDRAGDSAAKP